MHSKIREMRAERAKLVAEARAAYDTESASAEDEARGDKIMADADAVKVRIDREERILAAEDELRAVPGDKPAAVLPGEPASAEERTAKKRDEATAAFRSYLVHGEAAMAPEQRVLLQRGESRDLGTNAGTLGGFTVPEGFYDKLTDAQKWYGGMRASRATVIKTESGQPIPIPTDNDTTNVGALVAEGTLLGTQDTTFGQKLLNAYMYTSKIVRVSIQMLQDPAFDIEGWLTNKLGIRIARIVNTHLTVGDGAAKPQGIVTSAVQGKVGATGQTTSIIYDDLVDLEHSVDKAYRDGAQFMMHDLQLKALKKMKDLYGRPLWLPGIAVASPDTILSYPYVVNNDMAPPAANAVSLLFGDLSNYFIRDVRGTQVLRLEERYADYLQVGFLAFERHDGVLVDAGTNPVKYYQNSAT